MGGGSESIIAMCLNGGGMNRIDAESETLIVAPTLTGNGDAHSGFKDEHGLIALDTTQITSAANRSNPQPGNPCHTLAKGADAPCIARVNNLNGNSGRMQIEQTYVPTSMAVRRLLPIECERLQGFPDDFTKIPLCQRKKAKRHDARVNEFLVDAADGPRYKALGNSMAVPVLRWIAERIAS